MRLLVIVMLLIGSASSARADQEEAPIVTAPVMVDGNVVLQVRGVSSFPAKTRAASIAASLVAVAADRSLDIDSLTTVDIETGTNVVAGERSIMTITDADATLEGVRRPVLTVAHLRRLRQAIVTYRSARSAAALRNDATRVLIATVFSVVAFIGLVWFWRWVDRFLTRRLQARIHSVGIQSLEFMRAEQIWAALKSALRVLRLVAVLACLLAYLVFALAQFPWTRSFSQTMTALALEPIRVIGLALVTHVPNVLFLVVLFVVIRMTLRLVALFFDAVGHGSVTFKSFDAEWAEPTYKILRVVIVAFAVVVAYPYIPGAGSPAFQGVSLFIGIVFSLGSSSAIANMIAGYMITYRRAFKIGDRVKIGEMTGDILETRLQVTHLRSFKNEELVIPNSLILGSHVLNYSSLARTDGLILHTEVGIGYETPWRQVEAILMAAAERTPGIEKDPPPFVHEKALGDFAVTYELNVYCRDVRAMRQIYAGLHRNILDLFNEFGVQIMTPAYEGDPEKPKVVARNDWYAAPAKAPKNEPPADRSIRLHRG